MRGAVEDSPEPRDLGSDANFAPDPWSYWETLLSLSLSFLTCTGGLRGSRKCQGCGVGRGW